MPLFEPDGFAAAVASLPGTAMVRQWGSHVAKVGGKVFALLLEDGSAISLKVPETSFEILTSMQHVGQAPYFAKRQWVRVGREAELAEEELLAYLATAHRMIAAKLPRRLRAELGLTDPPREAPLSGA